MMFFGDFIPLTLTCDLDVQFSVSYRELSATAALVDRGLFGHIVVSGFH